MPHSYLQRSWVISLLYCSVSVSITDVPSLATLTCHAFSTFSASIASTTMVRYFDFFFSSTCCDPRFSEQSLGICTIWICNLNFFSILRHFRLRLQGLRQSFRLERYRQVNSACRRPSWLYFWTSELYQEFSVQKWIPSQLTRRRTKNIWS